MFKLTPNQLGDYSLKLKPVILALHFILATINCVANDGQTSTSRLFEGFGISMCSQFESSPVALTPFTYTNAYNGVTINGNNYISFQTLTIESCSYIFRYNLVEINNNASFSIAAAPCIALSVGWETNGIDQSYTNSTLSPGFLSLNIPAFIEFNYGNVSTFNADKEIGFVFGAGYEFVKAPVILPSMPVASGIGSQNAPLNTNTLWFEPVLETGYRYWSKTNKAREINLKYGFGSKTSFADENGISRSINPWTIKLTFIIYTNY